MFFHGPSFCFGAIIGAAIIVLALYAPEFITATGTPTQTAEDTTQDSPKIEFQFDNILREAEVAPDLDSYEVPDAASNNGNYTIQAASFRQYEDAEALRAKLLLKNLPVRSLATRINGDPWYRVVVGPFADKVEADRAMTSLRELNLSAIWLRDSEGDRGT